MLRDVERTYQNSAHARREDFAALWAIWYIRRVKSSIFLFGSFAVCVLAPGCAGLDPLDGGTGGSSNSSGGASGGGGAPAAGGTSSGGGSGSGGRSNSGGSSSGGALGAGGGSFGAGGSFFGSGGSFFGAGGSLGTGGGATGSGGSGTVEIDCDAQMPTSGGMDHSSSNQQGGSGNTAWSIWTNGGPGQLTTYGDTPAFKASWNNSGDYLGRMGFEWGNSGKPYTEYGTIKADYVWNKEGNAGQYSYIGLYGWSNNPCVEWYIVEDSFHQMPFNTGDRPVGTTEIDGGTYNLVYRHTTGTGGSRCNGTNSWDQFYSIRLEGKRCGTITVSDHFAAWAAQGWNMGSLLEVKIVVEAAAGTGSVEFPLARVSTEK